MDLDKINEASSSYAKDENMKYVIYRICHEWNTMFRSDMDNNAGELRDFLCETYNKEYGKMVFHLETIIKRGEPSKSEYKRLMVFVNKANNIIKKQLLFDPSTYLSRKPVRYDKLVKKKAEDNDDMLEQMILMHKKNKRI